MAAKIVRTPDTCGNRPRLSGRRIRVQDIYWLIELNSFSQLQAAEEYDLTPEEVQVAVDYYKSNLNEIITAIDKDKKQVELLIEAQEAVRNIA